MVPFQKTQYSIIPSGPEANWAQALSFVPMEDRFWKGMIIILPVTCHPIISSNMQVNSTTSPSYTVLVL
jgi:hypothetical protein